MRKLIISTVLIVLFLLIALPAQAAFNEKINVGYKSCASGYDVHYNFKINMDTFQFHYWFQGSNVSSSGPWITVYDFKNVNLPPGSNLTLDTNYRFTNQFYNNRVEFFSGGAWNTGVRDIASLTSKTCGP